jgi:hypothetical protein
MTSTGRVAPNEGWPNVGCETEAVSKGRGRTKTEAVSKRRGRAKTEAASSEKTDECRSSEQTRGTNEDRSSEPIADMAAKGRIHSGPVTQVAVVRLGGDPSALLTHPPGHAHAVCGCLHCMRVSRPEEYQDPIGTHGDGIATAVRL